MTKEELKELRVRLYKASPTKLDLVDELISAIKNCFHGVETTSITFDGSLKIGGLKAWSLDLDEIGGVLVHWEPDYNISTKRDPYCSAYILTPRELRRIISKVKDIKTYYDKMEGK